MTKHIPSQIEKALRETHDELTKAQAKVNNAVTELAFAANWITLELGDRGESTKLREAHKNIRRALVLLGALTPPEVIE